MGLSRSALLLSALLLSTLLQGALSATSTFRDYSLFVKQHTYSQDTPVHCGQFMNSIRAGNKERNSIILGDRADPTDMNALLAVCRGEGHSFGGNLMQSNRSFRVITCILKREPYQSFRQYTYEETHSPIIIGCQDGLPVHFDSLVRGRVLYHE